MNSIARVQGSGKHVVGRLRNAILVIVGIMAIATGTVRAQWAGAKDTEPPAVTIKSVEEATKKPFAVQFVFSEVVEGFDRDSVSATNATLSDFRGSRKNYQIKVSPNGRGNVKITVSAHAATDTAGNTGPTEDISAVTVLLHPTKKQNPSAKKDGALTETLERIGKMKNLNPSAAEARKKAEEGATLKGAQLLRPIQPISREDEEFLMPMNQE